jgi:hypothetical protein
MIVDLLVWAFVVYILLHLGGFIQRMKYEMELDEIEENDNEDPQDVIAMIDYIDGIMYAWDGNKFLGQGVTMDILEEHMKSRIPELYDTDVRVQLMTENTELIAKYKLTPI